MKQIRTTIESPYEPNDNGVLWLDTSNPDAPILKAFTNGKQQATIGGEKVTEISSDSTNEEIPSAKAVNDRITALADEVGVDLDKYKEYFTIETLRDQTTVYFRQSENAVDDGMAPLKVEVSVDEGETWTEVTAAPAEDDVPGAVLATLDAGDKVLIRGNNPAYGYHSDAAGEASENCNFWADEPCYVYGNIMSLVSKEGFEMLRSVNECTFAWFLSDYDGILDWSWVLSREGDPLLLPATTLAQSCYYYMFSSCTNLTTAPELPATTLADWCYSYMFSGCTSLTSAPELPATTLTKGCYNSMFNNCTKLSYIKALFTTTPSNTYTLLWVQGVNSTGTFVKSTNATWNVSGDNGVPSGWTVKEQSPEQRDDQADWEETNSDRASYIWNKPTIKIEFTDNTVEITGYTREDIDRALSFNGLPRLPLSNLYSIKTDENKPAIDYLLTASGFNWGESNLQALALFGNYSLLEEISSEFELIGVFSKTEGLFAVYLMY